MPNPGDQHYNVVNPFEEVKPRISEYTAQEISTLQSRLEKQLGPEYISSRAGPSGQKVHYITAEKCIALANEVFGFNGWSSSIQNIQVDFVDEHPQTMKISLGLSVVVRITLRDGTFHEDIGYGHMENCKGKAAAFEKAKKEGTTDALKRALRSFGNVLGNCIYDKDYLAKVTKMKVAPTKFDEKSLHRHSDFALKDAKEEVLVKKESPESFEDLLGEFDEADFCVTEDDHPDEVVLPTIGDSVSTERPSNSTTIGGPAMQPPSRPLGRASSGGNYRPPQTPHQGAPRPGPQGQHHNRPQPPNHARTPSNPGDIAGGAQHPANGHATPPLAQNNEPIAFFSARAVQQIPESSLQANNGNIPLPIPAGQQVFNPKAESPSIRKTPGIDHTSSKPLSRTGHHVPPASSQPDTGKAGSSAGFTPVKSNAGPQPGRPNISNPQIDHTRRIGAPGAPASPLGNRGSYRPPTMKRSLPQDGGARPALAEVGTNGTMNTAPNGAGIDAKRQKTS